ncbi:MAG: DUF1385 domain-containing protein [Chloroflexi bacterium]|nr:DUF1385 domain-containing protein [Chloroflexota bacterium]
MMRGSRTVAVAVRNPEGHIVVESEPLNELLYRGFPSRIPFVRGLVSLWDSLGLGMKALFMSADVAVGDEASFSGPVTWGTAFLGVALGVGLFMVLPSFLIGLLTSHIHSGWMSSLLEGIVRLVLVVGYIWAVGRLPDIQRVFAYHGAEHKTINAYEAGTDLSVEQVRSFSTAHARCGTAFLLTLVVVSVIAFAPLSGLPLGWRVISRILLLPAIAGLAYEYLRLTARLAHHRWMQVLIAPNLGLQRLSTREPDDSMIEVAITALRTVLQAEGVLEDNTLEAQLPALSDPDAGALQHLTNDPAGMTSG